MLCYMRSGFKKWHINELFDDHLLSTVYPISFPCLNYWFVNSSYLAIDESCLIFTSQTTNYSTHIRGISDSH